MNRLIGLLLFLLTLIGLVLWMKPITQPEEYHRFADQRTWFWIPHFFDVLSNLPFLFVGFVGLRFLHRHPKLKLELRVPFGVYFAAVAWVALGSAFYHWNPTSQTLFWDRLPMSVAFSALLAGFVADRIHARAGFFMTFPLVALGITSVLVWHFNNADGQGDLRFYMLVQFGTLLLIPGILFLYPKTKAKESNVDVLYALAWYGLAKVFEYYDRSVFRVGGIVSGHTLKHLAAAVSCYCIYRIIRSRVISVERTPL